MTNRSQDIYTTQRADDDGLLQPPDQGVISKLVRDELRRSQWSSVGVYLVCTASLTLVCVLLVMHYMSLVFPSTPGEPATFSVEPAPRSFRSDFTGDLGSVLMMDELREIVPKQIPEGGNLPLSAEWLKQAAHFVVMAERSERDELYEESLEHYDRARLIFPDLQGLAHRRGLLLLRLERYEEAVKSFEYTIENELASQENLNNLGVAYMGLKRYKDAEVRLLRALAADESYVLPHLNLATLYLRTDSYEKAAVHFDRYLRTETEDVDAAQTYALLLVKLKRWEKAALLLGGITEISPGVAPVYFRLAQAHCNLHQHEEALTALERGTRLLDPPTALAWLSRTDFDLVRSHPGFETMVDELRSAAN